jgi:hypothetical protein
MYPKKRECERKVPLLGNANVKPPSALKKETAWRELLVA